VPKSESIPALLSAEVARDPHDYFRRLRQQDHIHQDEQTGWYLVSRYDECAQAFKDGRFTSRNYETTLEPLHGRTILQMEGTEHSRRRSLVNPFLRGNGLQHWTPVISRVVANVLDDVAQPSAEMLLSGLNAAEQGATVDLVSVFTNHYPIIIVANMLGLPVERHTDFHRWYVSIVAFLSNFAEDPHVHEAGLRTQNELAAYILPLVSERRGSGGQDMISQLADAEIDGDTMSDSEVKAFVSLLLTAGGETTDKSTASLLRNLLVNRERYEAVLADPTLLDAAVAETLRYSPPTLMTMRQTDSEVELRDTVIPPDSKVLLLNASANRDESKFADPDEFVLGRPDLDVNRAFSAAANHLAFGGGRHFCVGAQLAQTEMRTALQSVSERFPLLRLIPDYQPPEIGIKTRGPVDLLVTLT
jgi:cytochrome P450